MRVSAQVTTGQNYPLGAPVKLELDEALVLLARSGPTEGAVTINTVVTTIWQLGRSRLKSLLDRGAYLTIDGAIMINAKSLSTEAKDLGALRPGAVARTPSKGTSKRERQAAAAATAKALIP